MSQPERVAGGVRELDHLVALVVMAEDDQPVAERFARRGDAQIEILLGEAQIALRQRLSLGQAALLVGAQQLNIHRRRPVHQSL